MKPRSQGSFSPGTSTRRYVHLGLLPDEHHLVQGTAYHGTYPVVGPLGCSRQQACTDATSIVLLNERHTSGLKLEDERRISITPIEIGMAERFAIYTCRKGRSMQSAHPALTARLYLNIKPLFVVEQCLSIGTVGASFLMVLFGSNAVYAIARARPKQAAVDIVVLSIFGLLAIAVRAAGSAIAHVYLFGLFLLVANGIVVAVIWMVPSAWLLWAFLLALSFASLLAISSGFQPGAKELLSSIAKNCKWAKNGSYKWFIVSQGMLRRCALLYFAGAIGLVLLLPFAQLLQSGLNGSILILIAAIWCYRQGGRHAIAKIVASEADLPPTFTLYLRSFLDDAQEVPVGGGVGYAVGANGRLEEIVVRALWPYSPIICIGKPGEALPELGAMRIDAGADWHRTVMRLSSQATRIVLTLSFTSGLAWEYKELFASDAFSKLIVIVPPELPPDTASRYNAEIPGLTGPSLAAQQMLDHWRTALIGTPLNDIETVVLRASVAIRFDEDETPIYLVSDVRNGLAYAAALRVACLPLDRLRRLASKPDTHRSGRC